MYAFVYARECLIDDMMRDKEALLNVHGVLVLLLLLWMLCTQLHSASGRGIASAGAQRSCKPHRASQLMRLLTLLLPPPPLLLL
jgi:hypothetical protein